MIPEIGLNGFEISEGEYSFVVDLEKKHCDCRLWMLRGIPCPHAICAYYYLNQDPDQHVEPPHPNMRMWPETTNPSIEPPKQRKMPGRPGKKRRKRFKLGLEEDWEEKKANARGTPFVTESDSSSSQLPPLSGHKRPYSSASFAAATGGNRRPATDFGVYSNPTTGAQVFNPGTSSEKILHGPTKLKSASPTNIDIGFKPRRLKWKGKDAVGTSQLQQMKANRKNWK
ncbi:hypothetical protein H5410_027153 [Solanum commersonii]|uniref:SWIM-type domain-containing protein n=1 Tax=Solanum commersonii TaxID=4109 RepID=A0A9J5Z0I3_SOLCO|nr:hypothetical protein H5410_027153 [Solanum commersonii]